MLKLSLPLPSAVPQLTVAVVQRAGSLPLSVRSWATVLPLEVSTGLGETATGGEPDPRLQEARTSSPRGAANHALKRGSTEGRVRTVTGRNCTVARLCLQARSPVAKTAAPAAGAETEGKD